MFNAFEVEKDYDIGQYYERKEKNDWLNGYTPLSAFNYTADSGAKTLVINGLAYFVEYININSVYEIDGVEYTVASVQDNSDTITEALTFSACKGVKIGSTAVIDAFNNTRLQYILANEVTSFTNSFQNNNQVIYCALPEINDETDVILNTCTIKTLECESYETPYVGDEITADNVTTIVLPKELLAPAKADAMFSNVVDKLVWQYDPKRDFDYKEPVDMRYEVVNNYAKNYGTGPFNNFNTTDIATINVITDKRPLNQSIFVGGRDLEYQRFTIESVTYNRPKITQMAGCVTANSTTSYTLILKGSSL